MKHPGLCLLGSIALAGFSLAPGASASGASTVTPRVASAGTWHSAIKVPGSGTLNSGGDARVTSLSCPSAGNCSAGGTYIDGSAHSQAFVANETNGVWHTAVEVPGTATLNKGGNAEVSSLSCASAGNCSAGGEYEDSSSHFQVFVVNETSGVWHTAEEVPGSGTLNKGGIDSIKSLSCASAGNCSAGGTYWDATSAAQAFVVNETSGVWHTAIEVPGTATLNKDGGASIFALSCPSAGNCSAGGGYDDKNGYFQAFLVDETSGTWHTAVEVPGTATLNKASAQVTAVSCASAGNCSAGGNYTDGSHHFQAFVVNETSGSWHTAVEVPGTATLNKGGLAYVWAMSCPSAGNCSAGGQYKDSSRHNQAYVANETGGVWHTAVEVPGTSTLNKGIFAEVSSLSCASAGNCSAGGGYEDASSHFQVFVVNETSGVWHTAVEVPGTATLNKGGSASLNSLSCASASNCSAGGAYTDGSGHLQAFVVNKS